MTVRHGLTSFYFSGYDKAILTAFNPSAQRMTTGATFALAEKPAAITAFRPAVAAMSDENATQAEHNKVNLILRRPWIRVFRDGRRYRIEIWDAPKGKSERYTGATLDEAIEKAKAGETDDKD
jgi:hypothetical protein